MRVLRSAVTGVGGYLPETVMPNTDFEKLVDTSDAKIVELTGIRQRHRVAEGQTTSDLAAEAAKVALAAAGKSAADVDMIVVATTTPDVPFPSTASLVQKKIGAPVCPAFDVQAVCSGFVYALSVADGFVARGLAKCVLVIGAEAMTRLLDFSDRSTCILFGDGAGAVVLEPVEGEGTTDDRGILGFDLRCDGSKTDLLYVSGGVFETPERRAELEKRLREITSRIRDESLRYHYQQEMRERVLSFFGAQRSGRQGQQRGRQDGRAVATGKEGIMIDQIGRKLRRRQHAHAMRHGQGHDQPDHDRRHPENGLAGPGVGRLRLQEGHP